MLHRQTLLFFPIAPTNQTQLSILHWPCSIHQPFHRSLFGILIIMSLSKFIKRARASTKSLLGDSYEEDVIDNPPIPEPPRDISAYSEERLKMGLRFADHSLRNKKRKVSPIAHHCLTLYKATLKAVLEKEYDDNDEKKELLSSVLLFERDIYTRDFLRRPVDTGDLNLVERLSQLRHFEFAARYGDYLARVCDQLKITARMEETKCFEQLNVWDRYWTDINSDINKEHTSWRKWEARDPAVTDADVKTTLAAFNACNAMGLNFDRVLRSIAMYADRSSLVHASIQRLVEQGQWHVLKDTLAQDLVDIPVVTPGHLRGNIPLLQETVQSVIDTYFDRRDGHRDDPVFWTPKEEAYDRAAKMAKEKEKELETVLAERKLFECVFPCDTLSK